LFLVSVVILNLRSILIFVIDDFFVGIGDINSSFLPKVDPITAGPPLPNSGTPSPSSRSPLTSAQSTSPITTLSSNTALPPTSQAEREEERERDAQETKQMVAANSLALEAQLEERPLAKKQEALLDDAAGKEGAKVSEGSEENGKGKEGRDEKPGQVKKALLKNDDAELQRVSRVRLPSVLSYCPLEQKYLCRFLKKSMHGFLAHIILGLRTI
jgi:RNA polymerase II subunit A-like phosphatase